MDYGSVAFRRHRTDVLSLAVVDDAIFSKTSIDLPSAVPLFVHFSQRHLLRLNQQNPSLDCESGY